jgi:hypothetical protein
MSVQEIINAGGLLVEMRKGYRGQTLSHRLVLTPEQLNHTPRALIVADIVRMLDAMDQTQQAIDNETAPQWREP